MAKKPVKVEKPEEAPVLEVPEEVDPKAEMPTDEIDPVEEAPDDAEAPDEEGADYFDGWDEYVREEAQSVNQGCELAERLGITFPVTDGRSPLLEKDGSYKMDEQGNETYDPEDKGWAGIDKGKPKK